MLLFRLILLIAILNGILSPWIAWVYVVIGYWSSLNGSGNLQLNLYISSLVLASLILLISGIPAALYERLAKAPKAITRDLIWLAMILILSLPMGVRLWLFLL